MPSKGYRFKTLEQRFSEKYRVTDTGCWEWTAFIDKAGYGRLRDGNGRSGESAYAHRVSYEMAKGEIPEGYAIDHLCRNRACVNPEHLEAVTHRVNLMRGAHPLAVIHRTGRCKRGHERTEENTYYPPQGGWQCRECRRIRRAAANAGKATSTTG